MQKGFPRTPVSPDVKHMPPPSKGYQGQYREDGQLTEAGPKEPAMRSGYRANTPTLAPKGS